MTTGTENMVISTEGNHHRMRQRFRQTKYTLKRFCLCNLFSTFSCEIPFELFQRTQRITSCHRVQMKQCSRSGLDTCKRTFLSFSNTFRCHLSHYSALKQVFCKFFIFNTTQMFTLKVMHTYVKIS